MLYFFFTLATSDLTVSINGATAKSGANLKDATKDTLEINSIDIQSGIISLADFASFETQFPLIQILKVNEVVTIDDPEIFYPIFSNCITLVDIDFPLIRNMTTRCFENCYSLTTAKLTNCISIESFAFSNCYSLVSIELPELLELTNPSESSIEGKHFYLCIALQVFSAPKLNLIEGTDSFASCSSLETFSGLMEIIPSHTFLQCTLLKSVELPHCTELGKFSFCECKSLVSIKADLITKINVKVFYNCYSLAGVTFNDATIISEQAFFNCVSLEYCILKTSNKWRTEHLKIVAALIQCICHL